MPATIHGTTARAPPTIAATVLSAAGEAEAADGVDGELLAVHPTGRHSLPGGSAPRSTQLPEEQSAPLAHWPMSGTAPVPVLYPTGRQWLCDGPLVWQLKETHSGWAPHVPPSAKRGVTHAIACEKPDEHGCAPHAPTHQPVAHWRPSVHAEPMGEAGGLGGAAWEHTAAVHRPLLHCEAAVQLKPLARPMALAMLAVVAAGRAISDSSARLTRWPAGAI